MLTTINALEMIQGEIQKVVSLNADLCKLKDEAPEARLLRAIFGEENISYKRAKRIALNNLYIHDLNNELMRIATGNFESQLNDLETKGDLFKWLGQFEYPSILFKTNESLLKEYHDLLEYKEYFERKLSFRQEHLLKSTEVNAPALILDNERRILADTLITLEAISNLVKIFEARYPKIIKEYHNL